MKFSFARDVVVLPSKRSVVTKLSTHKHPNRVLSVKKRNSAWFQRQRCKISMNTVANLKWSFFLVKFWVIVLIANLQEIRLLIIICHIKIWVGIFFLLNVKTSELSCYVPARHSKWKKELKKNDSKRVEVRLNSVLSVNQHIWTHCCFSQVSGTYILPNDCLPFYGSFCFVLLRCDIVVRDVIFIMVLEFIVILCFSTFVTVCNVDKQRIVILLKHFLVIDMFHLRIIGCLNDLAKRQLMFASFLFKYIRKPNWLGWWQNITTSSWIASNGNSLHGFVLFAWMIFEFISTSD